VYLSKGAQAAFAGQPRRVASAAITRRAEGTAIGQERAFSQLDLKQTSNRAPAAVRR